MNRYLSVVAFFALLVSCNSPERQGKDFALQANRIDAEYVQKQAIVLEDFARSFNPDNYTYRREVGDAVLAQLELLVIDYQSKVSDLKSSYEVSRAKLLESGETEKVRAFDGSFEQHRVESDIKFFNQDSLPDIISSLVRRIIPPLPDQARICEDLVGHELSEGLENGYHTKDWVWKIEKGQISGFCITSIEEQTASKYRVLASMRLSEGYSSYDTDLAISYVLPFEDDWTIDYVASRGMNYVVTHEYDDYITASITRDGAFDSECVTFLNSSELSLVVCGDILTDKGWVRYSKLVPPHSSAKVGGLFCGGWVKDYKVNFIVRQ